ncbi:protein neuralized isoform X1 [Harmonia axyridis]|uniref:protein neuralized isoform X1 n=1 Tax=Harmonia axyridis TaxID=115357 RepID=UPI001E2753A7|nr:protein neuralized isoform X1 [Harmonia axyridis]
MGIHEPEKPCDCKAEKPVKSHSLFSPLKGKMKVLKKIKRRMGLASRSSSNGGGTNNLPPLLFHNVHGDNIRISRDGTVAKRAESFCKGIAFSSRPVKVNEKICIKFLEISINWSGVIRFGFTYNDPSGLRSGLPKYACPDLTNKPGYWAKALPERFCSRNTVLFYYVTSAGDVHFGINGEEKGIFFSGVDTRGPLWALIDVYGNSTAIEFVDVRHNLNNSRRNATNNNNCDNINEDIDRLVFPMQQCNIQQRDNEEMNLPVLRYQSSYVNYQPMTLHRTRGRNVRFNSSKNVAERVDNEFCQGYVFTARPLQLGERVVCQILNTDAMFQGCLALGLTSCDPSSLRSSDLPDDSNFLLDRPEYWVISRDFARNLNQGDEISFCIALNGEVQISRNGGAPLVVIHVDQSLQLWAFFDIFGSTQKIRVLSSPSPVSIPTHPVQNSHCRMLSPTSASESINSLNSQSELRNTINAQSELRRSSIMQQPSNARILIAPPTSDVQVHQNVNGGAMLTVMLPPSTAHFINQPAQISSNHHIHHSSHSSVHNQNQTSQQAISCGPHTSHVTPPSPRKGVYPEPKPTGTMVSSCSSNYIEPISSDASKYSSLGWLERNGAVHGAGTECTICYENTIDSVLYTCGHMCMCYECALQQWKGKGGGHCPLCRASIRDVIRTYKP